MSQAKGIITALDGDYALVKTDEAGGCGRCNETGGCGGANVGRMFCASQVTWRVLNPRGANVGDHVDIAVDDGAVGASALLIYVLPLMLFIGGAGVGMSAEGELGAIAGAVLALLLAWRLVLHFQKRRQDDPKFQPHIV